MKAPVRLSLRPSRPVSQAGQRRGSRPSSRGGKKWGPSCSSRASMTLVMVRPLVSSTAALKARQKSRSTSFQSMRPPEMSSSWASSLAVKSYST